MPRYSCRRSMTSFCGAGAALVRLVTACSLLVIMMPAAASWHEYEYDHFFVPAKAEKKAPKNSLSVETVTPAPTPEPEKPRKRSTARYVAPAIPVYNWPKGKDPLSEPVKRVPYAAFTGLTIEQALPKFKATVNRKWLQQFYEARAFEPVWLGSDFTKMSAAAMNALNSARSHGLNPQEYNLGAIELALEMQDKTLFELLMTDAVLHYADHLRDGQYVPRSADRKWWIGRNARPDLVDLLTTALESGDISAFLGQLQPPHREYAALKRELGKHLALAVEGGWPGFPEKGKKIEVGMAHPDVLALRQRLAVTDGAEPAGTDVYDSGLEATVKRFQKRHGLNDDGVIGPRTRRALAVSVEYRIRQIAAAMERWRWMPRDLGAKNVVVDIPAFRLWLTEDDESVLTMRTIVGKTRSDHQTPSFTENMRYLVFNPNWNVPSKIAAEELAPIANEDPTYFSRKGFKVYDKETGEQVDPDSVDWSGYGVGTRLPYRLVQANGDRGALGTIKFMFPNRFGIYLHDTPTRHLFKKEVRAYSHGCIRIAKPLDLASNVLPGKSNEDIQAMLKEYGKNRHLNLEEEIPVYIVYMTAWADENKAYFFEDIYSRDQALVMSRVQKR